jgi:hypothetical protein
MPVRAPDVVGSYFGGIQARQQQDYGNSRNALAQMEVANAPREMQARNRLLDTQVQGAEQSLGADKAKFAYAQLKQALDSGNPKAFVMQNIPDLAGKLREQQIDLASMDDQQAAQLVDGLARKYAGEAGMAPAAPAAFTLKPGETRYVGDKPVVSQPAKPSAADSGFTLSPGQTRFGPDGKPIANVAAAPAGADPKEQFARADKLRDEFNTQSKEFIGVANSYQRIIDSASDPSAAGDLSLIFNYMKVLDPGSTVREGEFATAQSSGSVPAQIVARYNKILSGERLAPEQRKDFVARAEKLYKGQETRWTKNIRGRYEKLAKDLGVDPGYVTGGAEFGVPQQAAPGGVAQFATEAEAEAAGIKPGTRVVIGGVPGTWQ